ncbi:MAG: thymidine phosphorylase, partial [Chloroflexota bacterium]|nr:thymidine phosphorylase [Chloroflexota bacterium]
TAEIAPADRKLYALRDATATVEVVQLIAASIMSKKLAEGLTGLVLDVKRGSGSFIPDEEREIELANAMIGLGTARGCPVVALLTAMDRPLGLACGNALEVSEAIDALKGDGPDDLMDVTYALGAEMLMLGGVCSTSGSAWISMRNAISSGRAAEKFAEIVQAQGGDPRILDDRSLLPAAPLIENFLASRSGFVTGIAPRAIGYGIIELGGGRRTMEDVVDPAVGFVIPIKPGDRVETGDVLATIHARAETSLAEARRGLGDAISIGDEPIAGLDLISHRITQAGVSVWARPDEG